MERPPKKQKETRSKPNAPNPTGKGGFQERPQDMAPLEVANSALTAKREERKAEKAKLFREEQELFKANLRTIALYGTKEDSVRAKATKDILDYIAQGNPDKVLEKSDSDEFGTLDEKLKQISDVYIEAQLKNQELERKVAMLEAMLVNKTKKDEK